MKRSGDLIIFEKELINQLYLPRFAVRITCCCCCLASPNTEKGWLCFYFLPPQLLCARTPARKTVTKHHTTHTNTLLYLHRNYYLRFLIILNKFGFYLSPVPPRLADWSGSEAYPETKDFTKRRTFRARRATQAKPKDSHKRSKLEWNVRPLPRPANTEDHHDADDDDDDDDDDSIGLFS